MIHEIINYISKNILLFFNVIILVNIIYSKHKRNLILIYSFLPLLNIISLFLTEKTSLFFLIPFYFVFYLFIFIKNKEISLYLYSYLIIPIFISIEPIITAITFISVYSYLLYNYMKKNNRKFIFNPKIVLLIIFLYIISDIFIIYTSLNTNIKNSIDKSMKNEVFLTERIYEYNNNIEMLVETLEFTTNDLAKESVIFNFIKSYDLEELNIVEENTGKIIFSNKKHLIDSKIDENKFFIDTRDKKNYFSIIKENNNINLLIGRHFFVDRNSFIILSKKDFKTIQGELSKNSMSFLTDEEGNILFYNIIRSNLNKAKDIKTLYKEANFEILKIFNSKFLKTNLIDNRFNQYISIETSQIQFNRLIIFLIFLIMLNFIFAFSRLLKKYEAKNSLLEISEKKFRDLYDLIPYPVFLIDKNGIIFDENNSTRNIFGEIKNTNFIDFIKKSLNYKDFLKKIFKFENNISFTFYIIIDDKKKIFNSNLRKISLSDNSYGTLAIFMDITEEETRKQELSRLYQAIETATIGLLITDIESNIIYANPQIEKTTGYSSNELLNKKASIFNSRFHSDDFFTNIWNSILNGKSWSGDIVNRRKNGGIYWESMKISPIINNEGKIEFFVAIKEEITKLKRLQEELTLQKDKAEKLLKYKSIFLANMSHEIRTPLNSVIGISELLKDTKLNEEQQELISILYKSSETLLELINNVLDMAKIDSGNLEIEKINFDIYELVEDITDIFSFKILNKGLEFDYVIDPDIPEIVSGDVSRLKQVIVNLIGNAVKFTHTGKISLYVRIRSKNTKTIALDFSVKDTGIGISLFNLKKIFEPFVQEDVSTTRKYSGTGLGLSISKKIVNLMGGDLTAQRNQDEGSTFSFFVTLGLTDNSMDYYDYNDNISYAVFSLSDKENSIQLQNYLEKFNQKNIQIFDEHQKFINSEADYKILSWKNLNSFKELNNHNIILLRPITKRAEYNDIPLTIDTPLKRKNIQQLLKQLYNRVDIKENKNIKDKNSNIDLSDYKILIVDDYSGNRKLMELQLKNSGINMDFANDGQEAYEKYIKDNYDLIIMDIQMPVMDGMKSSEKIRTYEKENNKEHIPIIIMTAFSQDTFKPEEYSKLDITSFLQKPVKKEELYYNLYSNFNIDVKSDKDNKITDNNKDELSDNSDKSIIIKIKSMMKPIIPEFLTEKSDEIQKLKDFLLDGNYMGIRKIAHDFQGSGSAYGFDYITELGKNLSKEAKMSNNEKLNILIKEFEIYLKSIKIEYID